MSKFVDEIKKLKEKEFKKLVSNVDEFTIHIFNKLKQTMTEQIKRDPKIEDFRFSLYGVFNNEYYNAKISFDLTHQIRKSIFKDIMNKFTEEGFMCIEIPAYGKYSFMVKIV